MDWNQVASSPAFVPIVLALGGALQALFVWCWTKTAGLLAGAEAKRLLDEWSVIQSTFDEKAARLLANRTMKHSRVDRLYGVWVNHLFGMLKDKPNDTDTNDTDTNDTDTNDTDTNDTDTQDDISEVSIHALNLVLGRRAGS